MHPHSPHHTAARPPGLLLPCAVLAAVVLTLLLAVLSHGTSAQSAGAATLAAVNQCNGTDNVGGQAVACDVAVTNNLDVATGLASSILTVTECHGAANAIPTCTITTTPSSQLTTSVTQCNGSGNGGGGTVDCTVHVIDNITGNSTSTPSTINQCNQSGTDGGTQPTVVCTPIGVTTNADITQCNQSGTGGGAAMRVQCSVTPSTTTSALPISIDQCVGSGTGGGATVTCTASIVNNLIAVTPTTTAPTAAPTTSAATTTVASSPAGATTASPPSGSSSAAGGGAGGAGTPSITVGAPSAPAASTGSTAPAGLPGHPTTTTPVATVKASTSVRVSHPAVVTTTATSTPVRTSTTTNVTTSPGDTTSTFTTGLPNTGNNSRSQVGLAALLLAGGGALLRLGQRKRWVGKHR